MLYHCLFQTLIHKGKKQRKACKDKVAVDKKNHIIKIKSTSKKKKS